jgi:four helix bundle protein
MKIECFEDMIVWQKAHGLVLSVYKVSKAFPREEQYGLTSQVRRSAVSICANISEGYRKPTRDFIRYLDISHGSLEETKYHLFLARDLGCYPPEVFNSLNQTITEIGKMLVGLKSALRSKLSFS